MAKFAAARLDQVSREWIGGSGELAGGSARYGAGGLEALSKELDLRISPVSSLRLSSLLFADLHRRRVALFFRTILGSSEASARGGSSSFQGSWEKGIDGLAALAIASGSVGSGGRQKTRSTSTSTASDDSGGVLQDVLALRALQDILASQSTASGGVLPGHWAASLFLPVPDATGRIGYC